MLWSVATTDVLDASIVSANGYVAAPTFTVPSIAVSMPILRVALPITTNIQAGPTHNRPPVSTTGLSAVLIESANAGNAARPAESARIAAKVFICALFLCDLICALFLCGLYPFK
jgi:hypothetical protein